MTERVQKLINHLYLTDIPLSLGCIECGFSETDLTNEEKDIFEKKLFMCDFCGLWEKTSNGKFHDYLNGDLCMECAQDILDDFI